MITIVTLFISLFSINGLSADHDSVIRCFQNGAVENRFAAAVLCSNVENQEQVEAVHKCFDTSEVEDDDKVMAVLCSKVKQINQIEGVHDCYRFRSSYIENDALAASICSGPKAE